MFQGSANFVGRQHELSLLRERLQQPNVVAISAVSGMGGVGKTELATQYVRQYEADYPGGICWLNARESDLAADILQFALLKMNLEVPQEIERRKLNLEQQVEWCWQNWRPTKGLVLIVLDDVTSLKSCRKLLPKSNRFRILMTTRLRRIDTNFVEISLDVLSAKDALIFLTKVLGEQDQRVKLESLVAESLCAWLGYLPLGLELVGRYLVEDPDLSLAEMLQCLQDQQLQDEAIDPTEEQLQDTEMTAKRGVKAAFELSWRELNQKTQCVGELLSLFAPDVIPWKLVELTSKSLNWVEADVKEAKKQLYKLHLIQRLVDGDSGYKIHPLIREFLKLKLAASEQTDELKRAFAETFIAIAQKIPYSPIRRDIESVLDAIPHLAEVVQNLIDAVSDENLILVFFGLDRFYSGQGLYALAESWDKQCVSVVESRLGKEHPDVATSYNNLAELYRAQGRYSEAEPLFKKALELTQRLLTEEHPSVASSYNNLALLYHSQGRYSEAEPLYKKALELWQRLLTEEHPDVATSYNNLAGLYYFQGRYSEAEPLYKKALELTQRLLTEEHPDVATSYNNLALLYYNQGRYSEAEPLYKKALELKQRLLTEEHPSVATSYNNLAELYRAQRRYSEAEPLYKKALELWQRLLTEEHPSVATSYNNLALLYYDQGRYSEAEPLYKKALELKQRLLTEEHPSVASSYNNLALLYYDQGRYSEAEPLYQKALRIAELSLGVNHPNTITMRKNLENCQS